MSRQLDCLVHAGGTKRESEALSAVTTKLARHEDTLATYAAQQKAMTDKVNDLLDMTLSNYVVPVSESARSHPGLLQENMADLYGYAH